MLQLLLIRGPRGILCGGDLCVKIETVHGRRKTRDDGAAAATRGCVVNLLMRVQLWYTAREGIRKRLGERPRSNRSFIYIYTYLIGVSRTLTTPVGGRVKLYICPRPYADVLLYTRALVAVVYRFPSAAAAAAARLRAHVTAADPKSRAHHPLIPRTPEARSDITCVVVP